jgi:hypothetical protein
LAYFGGRSMAKEKVRIGLKLRLDKLLLRVSETLKIGRRSAGWQWLTRGLFVASSER